MANARDGNAKWRVFIRHIRGNPFGAHIKDTRLPGICLQKGIPEYQRTALPCDRDPLSKYVQDEKGQSLRTNKLCVATSERIISDPILQRSPHGGRAGEVNARDIPKRPLSILHKHSKVDLSLESRDYPRAAESVMMPPFTSSKAGERIVSC